ncbi:MAG: penicillin-binding protein 1C [Burkholderiaceae bacterium]
MSHFARLGAVKSGLLTRRWIFALASFAALLLCLDLAFPLPPAARTRSESSAAQNGNLVVLAADGSTLRTWPSEDGALRHPVQIEDVSPHYLQALLTYEDRWFYWHPGINPVALLRAGWQWAQHGRIVSGGSTLTMQVARILDAQHLGFSTPRSLLAKVKQLLRAMQLEAHLSKRDILTLYLNHAPMGGQVHGVEMASRAYLGKPAKDLSQAEAALLVALPQTPSRLRPDRAPQQAQKARDKVLLRMQDLGVWTAADVQDARIERVFAAPLRARWLAPLAAERLRQEQAKAIAQAAANKGQGGLQVPGNIIQSTLDAGVQTRLEQVLVDRLPSLPELVSIAALVVENDTLAVRGYAGSADFTDTARAAHVDMVRGVRSPGSTLKPFLYAMALDDGLVHSESLLIDAPQNFGGYAPGNFQASFSGPVSVSDALQRSLNVPAVDLIERVGPARFAAHLRNAGVKLRMERGAAPNLSLILGGGGTTLEELVGAYTALARGGMAGQPRLTPNAPLVETRLMSAGAAFIVREILENGGRPDTPFRESNTRVAWKTGTSFGFRDAWAVGVSDRYTVGIWVGRPDGTPNPGFFGANTSAPLLRDVMAALGDTAMKAREVPAGVQAQEICWPLGLAARSTAPAHCRVRRTAWTLQGTAPPTLPERLGHDGLIETGGGLLQTALVDPARQQRLRPGCNGAAGQFEPTEFARWPLLLQPWIEAHWRDGVERLPLSAPCSGQQPSRSLKLTGIDAGSVIQPAPGSTRTSVRVQAIGSSEPVNWLLNGRLVGTTGPANPALRLPLPAPGAHALTAMDAQGRYEQVLFSVR